VKNQVKKERSLVVPYNLLLSALPVDYPEFRLKDIF